MNILWFSNISLPEASKLLNQSVNPCGSWLVNTSSYLSEVKDVKLSIAFPTKYSKEVKKIKGDKIDYYTFPTITLKDVKSSNRNMEIKEIIDIVKPDVVHIFGTEYPHSLEILKCNNINKTVVSIQGLVSIYEKHYFASLPINILMRYTLRDFIKNDNIIMQRNKMKENGCCEVETLQLARYAIGRTTWDYASTKQINPMIKYNFCNEILREEFYQHVWDINKCEKFSIFISQATYPIKGLHFILEAMPLILKRFPNTKLYISGSDITKTDTLKEKLKKTSYAKYIIELIKKYNLADNIIFTGLLDEKQMCERYLKSNVFVCSSSIENSPNSLGEAMILGVPCVASDVGGISDMLVNNEEGFIYQPDASYMLAYYVCEIFGNEKLALRFSENAREHALKTHNREENTKMLTGIYNNIMIDNKE